MKDLKHQTELKALEIRKVVDQLNAAVSEFGLIEATLGKIASEPVLDDMPEEYFVIAGMYAVLQRTREFAKVNLLAMSDLELSSAVRFVFEMSLWFSFLTGPAGNGKRYFALVALENKKHLQKDIDHFEYELAGLRAGEAKFMNQIAALCEARTLARLPLPNESEIKEVAFDCRAEFAKKFSIYTDSVRRVGFISTADHIDKEILPDCRGQLALVEQRIEALRNSGVEVKIIATKRLAEMAGMEQEYSWLFSHTSRKIHAEPFSIQSDFSKLSADERFIYIDYLLYKVNEMLRVSFDEFLKRPEFIKRLSEAPI